MSDQGKVATVLENFAVVDHHTCKSKRLTLSATWQIFRVQPRFENLATVSCCQHNHRVRHLDRHKQSSADQVEVQVMNQNDFSNHLAF